MISLRELEAEFKPRMHKALSFDGVDDYVEVPDSASLDITDEITITVLVKLYTLDRDQQIVRKPRDDVGEAYEIFVKNNNRIFFGIRDSSGNEVYVYSSVTLNKNEWYYIAGTYNGTVMKLYLNQNLIGSTKTTLKIDTSDKNLYVGNTEDKYRPYCGIIDEVRIYNRALSESEIKYLYNNPFDPIDPDSLVLWLTPASIDVANGKWWDLSKYGNHGIIYGATEVNLVEPEVFVL